MRRRIAFIVFLFLCRREADAQSADNDQSIKFMGRAVTITEPETDADGFFPKGPASVCIEGPPQRQCYTAPRDFGGSPTVTVVQLKDMSVLFFSAASGGVSGWGIHFALLRPGAGKDLENLLLPDLSVSNISQHAFWNDATVSDAPIFVTANFAWERDECHYCDHRYKISSYTWKASSLLDGPYYSLEDEYMTVANTNRRTLTS